MKKRALIVGATGQLAYYLIELLLSKNYDVYGLIRRTSTPNTSRIKEFLDKITLITGDITDESSLIKAIEKSQPEEIYNLAAQSQVHVSFEQPILTSQVTGIGVLNLLCAIKHVNPKIKLLQSSSSEMFGKVKEIPQTELTPFWPRSPYAVAKCFGHMMCISYRESYGMFCSTCICFNFESKHRGIEFITKKVVDGVRKITRGESKELRLGNIHSKRDFNFAGDTARAMWLTLQHDKPDDFVVASGETHCIEEVLEIAFNHVGLKWQDYVVIDPDLFRPAEVDILLGDSSKIRKTLGWNPTVTFEELITTMMIEELKL